MKAISSFIVHVFNLIEAEGAALRTAVRDEARRAQAAAANLATGAGVLIISIPLLIAGFGLLAAGLMWWLETQVSRPAAASLTGAGLLAVGAGGVFSARWLAGKAPP